jgi:hypothetical protein
VTESLGGFIGPRGGLPGSQEVARMARDLHRMGRAGRGALRKRFRVLASPLLAEARSRASWSSRIPGAISVRTITDENRGRIGLQLRVSAAAAPHARPYEGINMQGNEGYFRHPVYGNTDAWVSQTTRPFAWPAVAAQGPAAREATLAAFEDAAREAGFR